MIWQSLEVPRVFERSYETTDLPFLIQSGLEIYRIGYQGSCEPRLLSRSLGRSVAIVVGSCLEASFYEAAGASARNFDLLYLRRNCFMPVAGPLGRYPLLSGAERSESRIEGREP